MQIVFLTGHDASAPRRVDFHFWADALEKKGADLKFITVGCSALTPFKPSPRQFTKPHNTWVRLSPHVEKFVWWPLFHPMNMGPAILNKLSWPLLMFYPYLMGPKFLNGINKPDVFIVENGAGLMLVPRLARLYPNAKFIYTVSDRMKTLNMHPILMDAEQKALPYFHKIRLPALIMQDDFAKSAPTEYIAPGLEKSVFDQPSQSPYKQPKNAISVGDMLFDAGAIIDMARGHPDWQFHLFGKKAKLGESLPNVTEYGEQPFSTIVPYIKHADIGLATYGIAANADYLSQSSLKMMTYTYCKLPIVAPDFAAAGRPHVCAYAPGKAGSPATGFAKAITFDRASIDTSKVLDWDSVIDKILAL